MNYIVKKDGYVPFKDLFVIRSDSTLEVKLNLVNTNNNNEKDALCIYPNPARDKIVIKCSEIPFEYFINDLTGRTILFSEVYHTEKIVDISNLSSGLYIVSSPQFIYSKLFEKAE